VNWVKSLEVVMKSPIVKRSIVIAGHKTSVSLEDEFWKGLKEIASDRNLTLSEMVASIDSGRAEGNLSSAIRLFVLDHYRTLIATAAGARKSHSDVAQGRSGLRETG
jgi:predicted DNA-binding ribbon-helix-helix protein